MGLLDIVVLLGLVGGGILYKDQIIEIVNKYLNKEPVPCTKTCTTGQHLDSATCTCIPDTCTKTCPTGQHIDSNCNCVIDEPGPGPGPGPTPGLTYVYESKFGSQGSGNGQFKDPHDVSFDKQNNAFIPDRGRNDIQVFTHSGQFVRKFGGPGSGNGQFNVPYSTTHDSSDNFYVADRGNNRIQKLSHDGAFILKITSAGGKTLKAPEDIAFDYTNGDYYVCDTGNNRILKFDKNDKFILQWGSKGSGNGQFDHPHSIDVGTDRNVYISCGNQPYVQKFTPTGGFLKKWGSEGNGPGQTRMFLEHMDIDRWGRLHLINNDIRPIINVWDQEGNYLTYYGNPKKGSANGQFSEPEHVTVDNDGKPWVVDSGNFRIQIFKPTGSSAYTKTFRARRAVPTPMYINRISI